LTIRGEVSTVPLVITVVGESMPVIKKTVIRDWQKVIMKGRFIPSLFNKQDFTYKFSNGSIMQFISADDENRFYGIRHDYVLIDEAYNVNRGIFDQIDIRTGHQILLTWNPVAPFWATKLEDQRPDVTVIHSTYKDNPFLDQNIIDALEIRAAIDPNFYRVFVLGEYGTLEGLIFKEGQHWWKCESLPEVFKRRIFVIDFGFTQDPTAILEIKYSDGKYWIEELVYKRGLYNSDIFNFLRPLAGIRTEIIADSAEPKSIAEIKRMGLNVIPCQKGPDSVKFGISTMQSSKLMVTASSINTIKEFRNYSYFKTRDGEYIDKPVDNWNHSIDAIRYGITHLKQRPNFGHYSIS